ncbi:MAG: hypothetical protein JO223_25115 [Hyphomicrobiales bacterium]|nr:hypothetical protein [Hyphomicrobiales bacterium]
MPAPVAAANRHERRRRAAADEKRERPIVSEMRRISIDQIKSTRCGWKGCTASAPVNDLSPGWTCLIVYEAPLGPIVDVNDRPMLDITQIEWRHDKALCPVHSRALDDLLTIGDGKANPLSSTAGNA